MFEIPILVWLCGSLGNMARRRGRNPAGFTLLLIALWFIGELAGAIVAYQLWANSTVGIRKVVLIYGTALACAAAGAAVVFLLLRILKPVDGVWREDARLVDFRPQLAGATLGGVGGGAMTVGVMMYMYGPVQAMNNLSVVVPGAVVVGFIGALLGMVFGIQKAF